MKSSMGFLLNGNCQIIVWELVLKISTAPFIYEYHKQNYDTGTVYSYVTYLIFNNWNIAKMLH